LAAASSLHRARNFSLLSAPFGIVTKDLKKKIKSNQTIAHCEHPLSFFFFFFFFFFSTASCLRCAQCDKVLEIGRAKCDNARRLAYCTLECAMQAAPAPAPSQKSITSPNLPTTGAQIAPTRTRDAATDVGVTPNKAKLTQFERVIDLRAVDLSQLHAQIDLARSQQRALSPSSPSSSSSPASAKSPPLSPSSPMDDDDVALLRWRDAERRRADLESQIEVVTQRRNSRRSNPATASPAAIAAAAAVPGDDAEDERRIATLRRESEQAATEVARAQAALSDSQRARADRHKTKHAHHKKSRKQHSRSPSPPPPSAPSPVGSSSGGSVPSTSSSSPSIHKSPPRSRESSGNTNADVEVGAVVQKARAGDTATMAVRRDIIKTAIVQRRTDMGNGEDTWK
jgi:hypothetical protein